MGGESEFRARHRPRHIGFSDDEILRELRRCAKERLAGMLLIKVHARHSVHLEITSRRAAGRLPGPCQPLAEAEVLAALAAVRRASGYGYVEIVVESGAVVDIAVTRQFPSRPPAGGEDDDG